MSRQQWGHGYYKGFEDAGKYIGKKKYLVCMSNSDAPHMACTYRVLQRSKDMFAEEVLAVEDITDRFSFLAVNLGSYGIGKDTEINYENVFETTETKITNDYKNVRWFATEDGVNTFLAKDFESWVQEQK